MNFGWRACPWKLAHFGFRLVRFGLQGGIFCLAAAPPLGAAFLGQNAALKISGLLNALRSSLDDRPRFALPLASFLAAACGAEFPPAFACQFPGGAPSRVRVSLLRPDRFEAKKS